MEPRIVIGVGSGRCGTLSLAYHLNKIPGVRALHEGASPARAEWEVPLGHLFQVGSEDRLSSPQTRWNRKAIRKRLRAAKGHEVFADVAFYFSQNLRLIEELIPNVKLIHLRRPREEVAESFIRKSEHGYNIRLYQDGGRHDMVQGRASWTAWGDCFAEYPGCSRLEGFARHWDDCEAAIAVSKLPRIAIDSRFLSDLTPWRVIADWIGVQLPEGFDPSMKLNATRL